MIPTMPCPFCGAPAETTEEAGWFRSGCIRCGIATDLRSSGALAADAWNTRSPQNFILLGVLMRDLRGKTSLRNFAKAIGLTAAYVSDLERGNRPWRKGLIERWETTAEKLKTK